jgi:hypothetical protein
VTDGELDLPLQLRENSRRMRQRANELVTNLRVEQGRYILGGGLAALDKIKDDASELRAALAPGGTSPPEVRWIHAALLGAAADAHSLPPAAETPRKKLEETDLTEEVTAIHSPITDLGAMG